MPIDMPKGLPFSVDSWTPCSKLKRHHFLTHAHKDHAQGILTHASYPVYSTLLTKTLILQIYPQLDESIFVCIEIGQSLVIEDPDGDFVVTAFDANHCPGAVMFLFEGKFGNILHTGDCRLTQECLQNLPDKYIGKKGKEPRCPLDYVFLDCTFGQISLKIPSKQIAIRQVINLIWKHPDARTVYLTCDLLGQEEILLEVSRTFGEKIYVCKDSNLECYRSLEQIVPEIISHDSSSRFQLFDGFPRLYERAEAKIAEARSNFQQEPLIIRPSTQWYACSEGTSEIEKQRKERVDQAVRDLYGVWHVCYSIHSSKEELEWALQLLAPKWVVSTTPSCRALELDYVKKHCFKNQKAFNGSLLKLLDIGAVESLAQDEPGKSFTCSDVVDISYISTEILHDPVVIQSPQRKRLSLSPPTKRPMFTLFGRARHGVPGSIFRHEHKEISACCDSMGKTTETENVSFQKQNVTEKKFDESLTTNRTKRKTAFSGINGTEMHKSSIVSHTSMSNSYNKTEKASFQKDVTDVEFHEPSQTKRKTDCIETIVIETCQAAASSPTSTASNYSDNLRKLYRSRNVPLPQPLPSLVKLMGAKRSAKNSKQMPLQDCLHLPWFPNMPVHGLLFSSLVLGSPQTCEENLSMNNDVDI